MTELLTSPDLLKLFLFAGGYIILTVLAVRAAIEKSRK